MQNKYINITFYSIVILLSLLCIIGTMSRFKADMYFDKARKCVPGYAKTHKLKYLLAIQFYYQKSIEYNPLEIVNYSNRLNANYLQTLAKK